MDPYSIDFFTDTDDIKQGPKVLIEDDGTKYWPFRVKISGITIYLSSESQLIQFVNTVNASYNLYRKAKGYDK